MPIELLNIPLISTILVSYNSRAMTLDCLAALEIALEGVSAQTWVVDNASNDGSVAAIRERFPNVQLIVNQTNRGFGAANNQAMQLAAGKFFLLLNTDAFVDRQAVSELLACLDRHPAAAMAGPRLVNRDGSLQQSCFAFPSPPWAWIENLWLAALLPPEPQWGGYRRWPHDRECAVHWIGGACMLVRRDAYAAVGGFDERFFLYSEETDWQRRMRSAGWSIVFTPAARVTHLGGASGEASPTAINQYFFNSLDLYELKHHGIIGLILFRLAMIVGCSLCAVLWSIVWLAMPGRRDIAHPKIRLHVWLVVRQLTHWQVRRLLRQTDQPSSPAARGRWRVA